MGFWTKIRKPLVGAAIGSVFGPVGAITGGAIGSAVASADAAKKKQAQQAQQAQAQQAQITQLAQEKAIASESARLQEEKARKRTLFAGTALEETSERKKLLGL